MQNSPADSLEAAVKFEKLAFSYHKTLPCQSVKMFRLALGIREKIQGKNHVETIQCRFQLAQLYDMRGELDASGALYRESLELSLYDPAGDGSRLGENLIYLGSNLFYRNRYSEAEMTVRRAVAAYHNSMSAQAALKKGNVRFYCGPEEELHALSGVYERTGRRADRYRAFRYAIEIQQRLGGLGTRRGLALLNDLAQAYIEDRRWSAAEAINKRIISSCGDTGAGHHKRLTDSCYVRTAGGGSQGDCEKFLPGVPAARPAGDKVQSHADKWEAVRQLPDWGEKVAFKRSALERLVRIYQIERKFPELEDTYRQLIEIHQHSKRVLKEAELRDLRLGLAAACQENGKLPESESIYRDLAAKWVPESGRLDAQAQDILVRWARVLRVLDNVSEAQQVEARITAGSAYPHFAEQMMALIRSGSNLGWAYATGHGIATPERKRGLMESRRIDRRTICLRVD